MRLTSYNSINVEMFRGTYDYNASIPQPQTNGKMYAARNVRESARLYQNSLRFPCVLWVEVPDYIHGKRNRQGREK